MCVRLDPKRQDPSGFRESPTTAEAELGSSVASKPGAKAVPLIVVGMNRSGTKWLSNILCNHPEVAGIQSPLHTGILETNFFGTVQRMFGEELPVDHYVGLVEMWAQSDFFKASGVEKELFYSLRPRPRGPLQMFVTLMEEMARRRGARYWLQKTSPLAAREILSRLPPGRVIVTRRSALPLLESTVRLRRDLGVPISAVRAAAIFALEEKILRRIERGPGALVTSYERMQSAPEAEPARLCAALGLSHDPSLTQVSYERNTSFRREGERDQVFSQLERLAIRSTLATTRWLPLELLAWVRERLRTGGTGLVEGTFREIIRERDLD
jgi:hypothetical protein